MGSPYFGKLPNQRNCITALRCLSGAGTLGSAGADLQLQSPSRYEKRALDPHISHRSKFLKGCYLWGYIIRDLPYYQIDTLA